ncbi:hypothetical protein [uncultured Mitsuokella sp.]|nr:hypothetical protein [uncultured Mitsuokella sp.]
MIIVKIAGKRRMLNENIEDAIKGIVGVAIGWFVLCVLAVG